MKNKELIYNLLEVLIAAEKVKDERIKSKDKNIIGESSTLFHLKRLKEMIHKELQ